MVGRRRSEAGLRPVGDSGRSLRLRLLRVPLPGGTTEVLATNLFDAAGFPAQLFKDLYRRRWAVEEEGLKPALRVEQFRTQGVLGVYQEVYARFLTLTLASIARATPAKKYSPSLPP
jgi:hypothetical protein